MLSVSAKQGVRDVVSEHLPATQQLAPQPIPLFAQTCPQLPQFCQSVRVSAQLAAPAAAPLASALPPVPGSPALPPLPILPPAPAPPVLAPPLPRPPSALGATHSSLRHCRPLSQLPSSLHGHFSDPTGQLEVLSVVP